MKIPSLAKLNAGFNFFIGLDQTGAVLDGGLRAKPLPLAWVDARGARPKLCALTANGKKLKLESFSKAALLEVLIQNAPLKTQIKPSKQEFSARLNASTASAAPRLAEKVLASRRTAILADAVFGLPERTWPSNSPPGSQTLRKLFKRAAEDTHSRKGYGLKPAAHFFAEILAERSHSDESLHANMAEKSDGLTGAPPAIKALPVREAERVANANSVFRTHPFQKNIQCGTYRFWRDLGLYGSNWIHLRYFERTKDFSPNRPILFEAYPSLMWREALKLRTRNRTLVRDALKAFRDVDISEETVSLIENDADHADACLLALGGYWLAKHGRLIAENPSSDSTLSKEGWIVGLPRS